MSQFSIDQVLEKYVTIRQIKRDLEKDHEEALKSIDEQLDKLEAWLLGRMNEDGVENYKTKFGTAYKSVKTSCTMADQAMFKEFVFGPVSKWMETLGVPSAGISTLPLWNLVDFRALKKGVEEYIEDNKQIPPGLSVTQTTTVNVRAK